MISDKKAIDFGIAIGGSLLLHAAVLSLFLMFGGPAKSATSSAPAATASVESSQPSEAGQSPAPATTEEVASVTGTATAGRNDVMDLKTATTGGDFEQTARPVRPTKTAKPAKTTKPTEATKPSEKAGKNPERAAKSSTRPTESTAKPDVGWKVYTVQRGEGLEKIARQCGCTVQELAKANRMKVTQSLFLGQKIKIPNTAEK